MKGRKVIMGFLLTAGFFALGGAAARKADEWLLKGQYLSVDVGVGIPRKEPAGQTYLADLYSPCAVLMEAESGTILEQQEGSRRIYPASLTKIMTAILAIECTPDLDAYTVLPEDAPALAYAQDASVAGFFAGEEVTYRDLLYGALLPSGAECCLTLAREISGTEEDFAERMNEKAKELGMNDTHFCNSTGLHEKKHYSTAADMAVLLRYALQNETFREAFTAQYYSSAGTAYHPDGLFMQSTMFASLEGTGLDNGLILGGKTGYTQEAGLCLASLARINDREYILVTADAPGSHDTEPYHIYDALTVYNRVANP